MLAAGDATNQRRARVSCDLCRRMKIRCDRHGGQCSHCLARGAVCHLTIPETKNPKVKKTKHSSNIEDRLQRMEILLQSSGIVLSSTPPKEETSSSSSEIINEQTVSSPGDDFVNLVINDAGAQKYIGPSSGFSLLSPRGLAWAEKLTGSTYLADILSKLRNQVSFWPHDIRGQWIQHSGAARHLLPSREVAQQLVNHYFASFNTVFPLFDRKVFATYLDQHYSAHPPTTKAWYAALNVVLSIGCHIATESVLLDTYMTSRGSMLELSSRFFQNACSVLMDLAFGSSELMTVQAVIGMAFIMQAALNPDAACVLLSMALRLGYAIGLHRWLDRFGLREAELEQRQLVFWIAYTLERSMSFRIGRPPAINDEDIGVPIPSETLLDRRSMGISVASNPDNKFYPFRSACCMSLIESKVYSELYSARSWMRSPNERLQRICRLDQELQQWKESIPIELRPEETIQCREDERFAVMMLQFSYYHCLTAIHRVSIHHGSWTSGEDEATTPQFTPAVPANSRIYASYALCVSAARSTIHLANRSLCLGTDPRSSVIWLAFYFPITACLTIFTHVLQYPLDPRIESDIELMERTLTHLGHLSDEGLEKVAHVSHNVFGELTSMARDYVKTARAGQARQSHMSGQQAPTQRPSPPNHQQQSTTGTYTHMFSSKMDGAMNHAPSLLPASFLGDFDFSPFDTMDPDPAFLFAHNWNEFDYATMDADWDFAEAGDDEG